MKDTILCSRLKLLKPKYEIIKGDLGSLFGALLED